MGMKKKNKKNLDLNELIEIVDNAYPDGVIKLYHAKPLGNHGDTLAKLIASELMETYDPKASKEKQLQTASRALERIVGQLNRLVDAIDEGRAYQDVVG